jgi:hypothetical protein
MPLIYPIWEELTREQAESISGTGIWKLPDLGKVSAIILRITADCAGINAQEVSKLVDAINKIEVIVNGSRELHSYSGQIAQAMAFYDTGLNPIDKLTEYASAMQRCIIPIYFGRYLGDPDLGLTCQNYDSVRLHVTNDMDDTYWDNLSIKAHAVKLEGEVDRLFGKGVLGKEEYHKYTTAQDGTEYVDLQEEGLLRRIILQGIPNRSSNKDACDFRDLFYDLKYTGKAKGVTFFDQDFDRLLWWNALDYGYNVISHGQAYRAAHDSYQHGAGMLLAAAFASSSADGAASSTVPTKSGDDDGSLLFNSYEADSPIDFLTKGVGIFHTGVFRHDRMDDMSDYLDMPTWKTLTLELHTRNSSSAASGDAKVVTERVLSK